MKVFRQLIDGLRRAKPAAIRRKRQERFNSVIDSKWCRSLVPVFARIERQDPTLTDQELLEAYYTFSGTIQTNTFAAAELEWATVAPLCASRPHLTGVLIRRGLLSMVWSIGDNITSNDVLDFIHQRILSSGASPYGGWPSDEGLAWLENELPAQQALVQAVLTDVITENKKDLADMND